MSLKNPVDYWKYSYINEKDKISKKLKEEFIDGIINSSKYRKKLKMTTHKWMIKEVVNSKEIKSRFNVEITKNKKLTKISTEVLILFDKEEFEKNLEHAYKIAIRKRDSFNVTLRRK